MSHDNSDGYYRTLFDTMGQGFCELELIREADGNAVDQRYIEFNQAFEHIFGIPVANAEGRTASEVFPNLDSWWTRSFEEIAERGEPERLEHKLDGVDRWFEVFVHPRGGDRLTVLYQEVTDRHQATEALQRNGEQQAFLLRLSDAMRAEHEPEKIGKVAVDMLAQHMGLDRCYVARSSPYGLGWVSPEYHAEDLAPMTGEYRINEQFPVAMQQLDFQPLIIHDLPNDPALSEQDKISIGGLGVQALLVGALRRGEEFIWGMGVGSKRPRRWSDADTWRLPACRCCLPVKRTPAPRSAPSSRARSARSRTMPSSLKPQVPT